MKLVGLPFNNNLYKIDVFRKVTITCYQTLGTTERYVPLEDGTIEFKERFQVRLSGHLSPAPKPHVCRLRISSDRGACAPHPITPSVHDECMSSHAGFQAPRTIRCRLPTRRASPEREVSARSDGVQQHQGSEIA